MALPRHIRYGAFDEAFATRLLTYAIDNQRRFEPSTVIDRGKSDVLDKSARVSLSLRDLGPLKREIRSRLQALAPSLLAGIGMAPFELAKIEVEMVAHNEGAFFETHIDTYRDVDSGTTRLMSTVYYFQQELPRYSGGALRLYRLGATEDEPRFEDIVPEHNALVAFPSWLPHEVRPVICPSGRFADSRFALNAWFLRKPQA